MASRRNLEETRMAILAAGVALMRESGNSFAAANISLIDACRRAGLRTAGSGYKIWGGQGDFRSDLQRYALTESEDESGVVDRLVESVTSLGEDPDLRELIRVAATENAERLIGTTEFARTVALWLGAADDPELRRRHVEDQREALHALADIYRDLLDEHGREVRSPFTIELLTLAISAEMNGLGHFLAYADDTGAAQIDRPTGAEGTVERWHLLGCVVEALVESFTRPKSSSRPGVSHRG